MKSNENRLLTFLLAAGLVASVCTTAHAGLKVGDTFPDLSTFKIEGSLPADAKGKIIIVDFWASWCESCKESFPVMNELQKKYGDKVVFIAVNVDDKAADKDSFLKNHPATFTIVRDVGQKLVDKAEIAKMPTSFVLDATGKVRFIHGGFYGADTRKIYIEQIDSLLTK